MSNTVVRDILRFFFGGKKMKSLDTEADRKALEDQGIDYTPSKQTFNLDTRKYSFKDKNKGNEKV